MIGRVSLLVVALCCCSVLAQFEHVDFDAADLNLSPVSATWANPSLHSEELATTIGNVIPGGDCVQNVHDVIGINQSSGNYFSVIITPEVGRTLSVVTDSLSVVTEDFPFSDLAIIDSTGGSFVGSTGSCTGATTCEFFYYCEDYTVVTVATVRVFSSKTETTDSSITYDLSFRQFTESISTMTSRTVTQTTAVDVPFLTTNPGPQNFVQYYHELEASLAEESASGRLYVEVNGFNSVTGTAYVCVSNFGLVSYNGALTAITEGSDDIDNDPAGNINSNVNTPSGCPLTCNSDNVSGDGSVVVVFDACSDFDNCGFDPDLFIGVIPPSAGSTYTVTIRFRSVSIPAVVSITTSLFNADGELTDSTGFCDGTIGDFSCDNYYELVNSGTFSTSDPARGPFVRADIFGVYDGVVSAQLTDGNLAGTESLCPGCAVLEQCSGICSSGNCDEVECYLMAFPCDWNDDLSNEWVVTVSGDSQDDSDDVIEYGIEIEVGEFPLDTVLPNIDSFSLGSVLPRSYHHYQVTFTSDDIFDDSLFAVELYSNSEQEDVRFIWRYNNVADDGLCLGYDGLCNTNDSPDGSFCRFEFLCCPIANTYADYIDQVGSTVNSYVNNNYYGAPDDDDYDATSIAEDTDVTDNGLKVAELRAGTYYFAVQGGVKQNVVSREAIDYTISWTFTRSVPIYDLVTSLHHVYKNDYSPQFYIDIPEGDDINDIEIRVSDVTNGAVRAFLNCGALAGECPCWEASATCEAAERGLEYAVTNSVPFMTCSLFANPCTCTGQRLFVSVLGLENGFQELQSSDANPYYSSEDYSIGFSLTAIITRLDENFVSTIEASRAVTTVSGSIDSFTTNQNYYDLVFNIDRPNAQILAADAFRYFTIDLSNVELSGHDSLAVKASAITQVGQGALVEYTEEYADLDILDVSLAPYFDSFPSVFTTSCNPSGAAFCIARLNDPYLNYFLGGQISGTCELVLQPCINAPACFDDETLELRQTTAAFTGSQYFITVENTNDLGFVFGPDHSSPIHFTLSTQIVDQSPVALTEDVPVAATVRGSSYQHFSFAVAAAPANSRLVAEFYQHQDQSRYQIAFAMNFVPEGAERVLAGSSTDCYANLFSCDSCVTNVKTPFCSYEVSPCDLAGQSGTYYLSAELLDSTYFDDLAEFTIKVHFVPTVELLEGGNQGLLEASSVLRRQTAFYSVTVPTLTDAANNIIGRIIDIDVEVPLYNSYTTAGIFVTITQEQPSDFCNCINAGHFVDELDDINWSRYSCELTGGETYYISVQGGQDDDDFDQTSFVVHAKLRNVIEIPVALTTGSLDTRVIGEYSNLATTSPEFGTVVAHNQFIAFSFNVNPVDGSTLNFEVFQSPQGTVPTTVEVYITRDSFYSPNGSNDGADIGPSPSRADCVPALATCVGTLEAGNECQLSIDPCELSAGTYFITISGESLPLGTSSQALNVHVVLTTPGVLNVPVSGVAATTSISFTDDIFGSYGVGYFTTGSLGLAAASELEFAYAGAAASMSVSYAAETDADLTCGSTCSDVGGSPSCDVIACNAVSANTWFVGIDAGGAATATTFTITPTVGPAGDLTSAGTITTTSGVSSFTALGTDEWRYHAYSVQASTSSHFELVSSLSANSIFYVDDNDVFRPNLVVDGVTEVAMQADGTTGTTCTDFSTGFFDEATCCYDTTTQVFAVVGNVGAYTLELEFVEFIDSVSSLGLGSSTGSQVLLNSQIDWWQVSVPAGQHIYFDFEVTDGEGELYMNRGDQSGSAAATFNPTAGGDFGSCWDNSGLVDAILVSSCNVGSDCNGFIAACDACLATDFSTTFTFAVIPAGASYTETVTYSLLVVGQVESTVLSTNNDNLVYPSNSLMVDDRQSNDPDAIYQFYTYEFTTPLTTIAGWVPVADDADITDDLDYPHVRFTFDNVRANGVAVTGQFPLDIFVSTSPFAGNNAADGCYGGRDITATAGGVFPCLETASGAASSSDTVIECSISVCDMACDQTLYFSVARSTSDNSDTAYTFDIEVVNEFDLLLDDFNFVQASVGTTTVTTDFTTSYVFVDVSSTFNDWQSSGSPQVLEMLFDNIDDNLGSATTLQIESVPQFSCTSEPIATDCTITSTGTASCELIYDPCTTQDALASIEELVFRVRRTAGSAATYSYDVTTTLITISPFDPATNVDVGTPYQHTKEIFDGEWQFFEFEVTPNSNYYWMTFDIEAVCCADVTDNLEVYYSWVSSGADVTDVNRRKRWPSESCSVTDASLSLNGGDSNDILDFCVFNGGTFRVSIFAEPGLQLFPEFPVTYSIDVNVFETVPVFVAPECTDTRLANAMWTGYYELDVQAENRGTELSISLSLASTEPADVTLHASNGPTPFTRRTNTQCEWATLGNEPLTASSTDYYCVVEAGQQSCTIELPACEFRSSAIYYLFVEETGISATNAVSISSHIDRKYIPVATLSPTEPSVSWDGMVDGFYQYYRVNADDSDVDFLFQATATSLACGDADCDYEMYLIEGEVGFAASANGDGNERSPQGSVCGNGNCFEEMCTFSEGGSCSLEQCGIDASVAFIGIRTTSEGHLCKYNLAVTVAADVTNLEVGKLTCSSVLGGSDHWLIVDGAGSALSFAESTMTINIEVGDDSDDLTVFIGNGFVPGSDCELTSFFCAQGDDCTFDVQCLTGNAYLSIYDQGAQTSCSDNTYAITVTRSAAVIQALALGQTSTATSSFSASASTTSFVYQSNVIAPFSLNRFSDGNADNDCRNNCPDNTPVLVDAIFGSPTYYFSSAAGMVLEQVTPVTLSESITAVTFTSGFTGNSFAHFVVNMPDGVTGYTVHFTDVDHCACDGDLTALDMHLYTSDIAPPFSECNPCDSGADMTTGGCDSSFNDFAVACHSGTSYISVSSCVFYTCDVTFNAYVTFDEAATAIPSGNHDAAFQTIISDNVACGTAQTSYEFFVDAVDILSVTAREPHGGATYDVIVSITDDVCNNVDACTAETSESGAAASCNAGGDCRHSCVPAGRYHVAVDTTGANVAFGEDLFELQVVNAWVPLSGTITNSIQGDTRHFYEVTNSGGSLQIDLTVTDGPAIEFDVFTGCDGNNDHFSEYLVCAAGTCTVTIPTEALAPNTVSYYIVLSSAQISNGPATNVNSEKDTSYAISVFQGSANCGGAPTTGFCADTAFEGINAFSGISNSVWLFNSDSTQDDSAACLFDELTDRCPRPTAECRQWLKIFSCLESFPQCDADGFQLGMCTDVCAQVEAACGTWLLDDPHPEWGCMSGRYVADSSASTCHTVPSPTPVPETFPPAESTNEEDSALTPIVVPDFPTIVIQLPSEVIVSTDFEGQSPASYTPDGDVASSGSASDASTVALSALVAVVALCMILL